MFARILIALGCCLSQFTAAQQRPSAPVVPTNFKLDMETAARLRPALMEQSVAPSGQYALGREVFARLVAQVHPAAKSKFSWQLRVVLNGQLNAYSSPDGGVYVESGLARLAGTSSGLWAAILSHEIAHIVRRDWARRYLYQKDLESGTGGSISLGDPGLLSGSWTSAEKASSDLAQFCRQMEVEADREGLMLMAGAGYHPDFVPALQHLLHARGVAASSSLYAMHPCWEERDRELQGVYTQASVAFEHRWPEWYSSPGGNPPVVVFADPPTIRRTSAKSWQIQVPMRCQNLAGAVEVVLRADAGREEMMRQGRLSDAVDQDYEVRQLTGCTSPVTTVVFPLSEIQSKQKAGTRWTDLYVIDAWGAVLARADLPKLPVR